MGHFQCERCEKRFSADEQRPEVCSQLQHSLWLLHWRGQEHHCRKLFMIARSKVALDHCTVCRLSSRNSSGLLAPGDILKNQEKYFIKWHFYLAYNPEKNWENQFPRVSNSNLAKILRWPYTIGAKLGYGISRLLQHEQSCQSAACPSPISRLQKLCRLSEFQSQKNLVSVAESLSRKFLQRSRKFLQEGKHLFQNLSGQSKSCQNSPAAESRSQRHKKRQIWQIYLCCYSFQGSANFWTTHW